MRRLRRAAHVVLLVGMVASCGPAATTPATSASASTAAPSTAPASAASASVAPPSSAAEVTPAASVMGLEDWSAAQLYLMAGVDPKIRPTCVKAPKLPEVAYDGVQCEAKGYTIGLYAFDYPDEIREVYFKRLAEHGVKPDAGEMCFDGKPGEGVDTPGNEGFELRMGCYVDEAGLANARMLFASEAYGESVYVGVTGGNGSIEDLFAVLFPNFDPGSTGCGWCAGQIWSPPGEVPHG